MSLKKSRNITFYTTLLMMILTLFLLELQQLYLKNISCTHHEDMTFASLIIDGSDENVNYVCKNWEFRRSALKDWVKTVQEGYLGKRNWILESVWEINEDNLLEHIDRKRDDLRRNFTKLNPMEIRKQYFYYLHNLAQVIGSTFTMEDVESFLTSEHVVPGKCIEEHNAVLGLDSGLKFLKTLARKSEISREDVLGLHKWLLGHVDPINAGLSHDGKYADINLIVNLLNNCRDLGHLLKHAVGVFSTSFQTKIFRNGQLRTSLMLLNLTLLRSGYPLITIDKKYKDEFHIILDLKGVEREKYLAKFLIFCLDHSLDVYLTNKFY